MGTLSKDHTGYRIPKGLKTIPYLIKNLRVVEWLKPRSESSWGSFASVQLLNDASKITKSRHLPGGILNVLGDLRFEHEFEIDYENDFSCHRPRLKNARA